MRRILLILSMITLISGLQAKDLKFDNEIWDFGKIAEEGGKVTHKFEFENQGNNPIVIHTVRTSCGCTTSEYSRRPITKGGRSSIEISFDPEYREGHFEKDIYIYSSASNEPKIIKITGEVTPRVLSLNERYPHTLESVARLGTQYITFRAIPHGRLVEQNVEFKSVSDKPFKIEFKVRDPKSMLQLYYDSQVTPDEDSKLEVGYFLDKESSMRGRIYDTVDIYIDGVRSKKMLYIKGLIVE